MSSEMIHGVAGSRRRNTTVKQPLLSEEVSLA